MEGKLQSKTPEEDGKSGMVTTIQKHSECKNMHLDQILYDEPLDKAIRNAYYQIQLASNSI